MQLFVEFGQMKEMDPEDEQVQLQVRKLQDYITDHFYTCSDKILWKKWMYGISGRTSIRSP